MKRTIYLLVIAFLISMVAFLSWAALVRAYQDEDDVWSEPNGYAHAYVRGSYSRFWYPFYSVRHEADIFECLKGRYHFFGYNRTNYQLYDVWGTIQNGATHPEYDPGIYNKIWVADTETWAPYGSAPNPNMEEAHASIGPPGST